MLDKNLTFGGVFFIYNKKLTFFYYIVIIILRGWLFMKNKKIIISVIFVLILILLKQIAYAKSGATVTLTPSKTTLKQGENLEINIAIKNTNIEAGIEDISGYLSYDKNIFELVKVDVEDKIEDLNLDEEKQLVLEEYVGMLDVLDLTNDYLIAGMEESEEYTIIMVVFSEECTIPKTSTDINIGQIKFKVLSNINNTTTSIKMTELFANEEEKLEDATTNQITVGAGTSIQITTNNTAATTTNSSIVGITNINNNTNKNLMSNKANTTTNKVSTTTNKVNTQQQTSQAKENLAETGTESMWPIFSSIIVSLGLYINYRRFKEIDE